MCFVTRPRLGLKPDACLSVVASTIERPAGSAAVVVVVKANLLLSVATALPKPGVPAAHADT